MRVYSYRDVQWHGPELRLGRKVVATIRADATSPEMYRVLLPGSQPSGMLNKSRAKDAALGATLGRLNMQEGTPGDALVRKSRAALPGKPPPITTPAPAQITPLSS
jgi:hypothetical protein